MPKNLRQMGKEAEELCILFLKKKKYKIIAHQYYCKFGEIDIIATCPKKHLTFIEVKSTKINDLQLEYKISKTKIKKIIKSALHYIQSKNVIDIQIQFDAIMIKNNFIIHYQNIFDTIDIENYQ